MRGRGRYHIVFRPRCFVFFLIYMLIYSLIANELAVLIVKAILKTIPFDFRVSIEDGKYVASEPILLLK